jgi:peptidoglycan/xylan/chitin deacetylase (PgdA/CDA1 family)
MEVLLALWTLLLGGTARESVLPPFAISRVATSEPVVALTFDACATTRQANGFDHQVFEILAYEQIPATFFLSGRWVETHLDAAREIAAAPWAELGNHTYAHPRLSQIPKKRLMMEIQRTDEIMETTLGRPAQSMRPPAGAWNRNVVRAAEQENLPVVLWSVVSGDAGGHVPAARMIRTVLEQTGPGAIVIFHINGRGPFTKDALPNIIAGLRDKGLRFVTVSQLLALPDATPVKAKPAPFGYRRLDKWRSSARKAQGGSHEAPPS